MKISITLPSLVLVDDYHELPMIAEYINALKPSQKVKVYDFGTDDNTDLCIGLVYTGVKPSNKVIKNMLTKAGISSFDTF